MMSFPALSVNIPPVSFLAYTTYSSRTVVSPMTTKITGGTERSEMTNTTSTMQWKTEWESVVCWGLHTMLLYVTCMLLRAQYGPSGTQKVPASKTRAKFCADSTPLSLSIANSHKPMFYLHTVCIFKTDAKIRKFFCCWSGFPSQKHK